MKKYVILALMFVPMVSFAAPSVRVLGSGTATSASSTTGAKVTPAKTTAAAKNTVTAAKATTANAGSRVGTVRVSPKPVGSGTTSGTGTTSRFPVITPAHSYNSLNKPQSTGGGTTVINQEVNLDNYYNKQDVDNKIEEINTTINNLEPEKDPRVDMIRKGHPERDWEGHPDLDDLKTNHYFMWIEE